MRAWQRGAAVEPLDPLVPWINSNSINFSNNEFKDLQVAPGAVHAGNATQTLVLTVPPAQ